MKIKLCDCTLEWYPAIKEKTAVDEHNITCLLQIHAGRLDSLYKFDSSVFNPED